MTYFCEKCYNWYDTRNIVNKKECILMDENKTGVSEEENIEKEENKKRLNKKKVIFIWVIAN